MFKSERLMIARLQRSFFEFIDELTDGQALMLSDVDEMIFGKHVTNRRRELKNSYAKMYMLEGRLVFPEGPTSS